MVHHIVPRTAKYFTFLAFFMSGSYAPVVLMPRPLRYFYACDVPSEQIKLSFFPTKNPVDVRREVVYLLQRKRCRILGCIKSLRMYVDCTDS
jgi:hypothetical protein